jgi:hypothetical protein
MPDIIHILERIAGELRQSAREPVLNRKDIIQINQTKLDIADILDKVIEETRHEQNSRR